MSCSYCGWPGAGKMPAGTAVANKDGKRVLVGYLTYFETSPRLCSICEDMKSTVENRPWFVEAHEDYLRQLKVRKKLLGQA